jgi:hypothetical protein
MDQMGLRSVKLDLRGKAAALFTAALPAMLLLLFISGCSNASSNGDAATKTRGAEKVAATAPAANGSRRLANARPSAEEISRAFLTALALKDKDKAVAMRLTKQEFCQYVFPELPSSKLPNVTCDFVWDQATMKSLGGFVEMWPRHEGRRYELISIRFKEGTDTHRSYKVHKETHLLVRDETGREQELRLFGSMLEMDGQFKLFSFVID